MEEKEIRKLQRKINLLEKPVKIFHKIHAWWGLGIALPVTLYAGAEYLNIQVNKQQRLYQEELIKEKITSLDQRIATLEDVYKDSTYIVSPDEIQAKEYKKLYNNKMERFKKEKKLYEINVKYYNKELTELKEKNSKNKKRPDVSTIYALLIAYVPLMTGMKLESTKKKYEERLNDYKNNKT